MMIDFNSFLYFMNNITLILLLIALTMFAWLAVRSRSIRSFQFQISIFIVVWILGELVNTLGENGIAIFSSLYEDIGLQVHLVSMILFTIMLWVRFYYSQRSRKKMVDNIDNILK